MREVLQLAAIVLLVVAALLVFATETDLRDVLAVAFLGLAVAVGAELVK